MARKALIFFCLTWSCILQFGFAQPRPRTGSIVVRDLNGHPIPSAQIVCRGSSDGSFEVFAVAGPSGRLPLPPALHTECRVIADGFLPKPLSAQDSEGGAVLLLQSAAVLGCLYLPDGKPCAGARVECHGPFEEIKLAVTGGDGCYRLDGLEPGEVRLTTWGEGLFRGEISAVVWPGRTARVQTTACVEASLRVVDDETARLLEISRLRIETGADYPSRMTCADDGGQKLLPVEIDSRQRGQESPRGKPLGPLPAGMELAVSILPKEGVPQRLLVRLEPGENALRISPLKVGTITGRLVGRDGRGVGLQPVRLSCPDDDIESLIRWSGLAQTRTDESGVFRFGRLPEGRYKLVLPQGKFRLSDEEYSLSEGAALDLGDIEVRPAAGLTGFVRTESGTPVEGGLVRACPLDSGCSWRASARTDHDGRFELDGLRPGEWLLEVKADGFLPFRIDGLSLEARHDPIDVTLRRGGVIIGAVLDPVGRPVGRAHIAALEPGALEKGETSAWLHPDASTGSFRWAGVPGGAWEIQVRAPGYGSAVIHDVVVEQGEESNLGEVVLRPGRVIRGRVSDRAGTPVAGAEIAVWDSGSGSSEDEVTWAGPDGQFELGGVSRDVSLLVRDAGYAPAIVRLRVAEPPAETWAEVVLTEGSRVEGQVTDAEGNPIGGAFVGFPDLPEIRDETDRDGQYKIERAPTGRWLVRMTTDPHRPDVLTETRDVLLVEGGSQRVDFDLSGTLAGRVLRRSEPVPWARVSAVAGGQVPVVRTAEADGEGRYAIHGLQPGLWTLHVSAPGACQWRESLTWSKEKQGLQYDINLPPAGMAGLVVDGRFGDPVAGVRVTWVGDAGKESVRYAWPILDGAGGRVLVESDPRKGAMSISGEEGEFSICVPERGQILLKAQKDGPWEEAETKILLPAREPVTIRLPRKRDRLRIEVAAAAGRSDCAVVVEEGQFYAVSALAADGIAKIDRPEGSFRIWAGCAGSALGHTKWMASDEDLEDPVPVTMEALYPVRVLGFASLKKWIQEGADLFPLRIFDQEGEELFRMGMATGAMGFSTAGNEDEAVLRGLPAGRCRVEVMAGGNRVASEEIVVGKGETLLNLLHSGGNLP